MVRDESQATADEQRFLRMALSNRINAQIIERLPQLAAPDAWLVSGCLFQTVWNCLAGKRPDADILDYDLFYFDDRDLGYQAEDTVIQRAAALFGDLGVDVQVRNQARVHLWYAQKFGIPCAPLLDSRDAIDHFLVEPSCLGVRQQDGELEVYAPFGFNDLFAMTVRPNCRRNLPEVYYRKARRWVEAWPGLEIIAWPES
jgi:hypothetical protein